MQTINIFEIKDNLKQNGIYLKNHNHIYNVDEYMDHWISVFESISKTQNMAEYIYQGLFKTFSLPIDFRTFTMYINFNIDTASQLAKKQPIITLQTKEISNMFIWTREQVENIPFNSNPILIAPLFIGKTKNIIIDGNHRISQAVKYNIETIQCVILSKEQAQSCVYGQFERAYYIFLNEMQEISQITNGYIDISKSACISFKLD